jgi:hypothetical protein
MTYKNRATNRPACSAGHVYRFRERVGGGLSAESPASVEVVSIDAYTGKRDVRTDGLGWRYHKRRSAFCA